MLARAVRGFGLGTALVFFALVGPAVATAAPLPVVVASAPPGPDGRLVLPLPFQAGAVTAPSRLQIPSLAIDAQVESLGVDATGAMETPSKLFDVGWFRPGPSPGARGDAVIDGHVGLPGYPLIFTDLARIAVGADLVVIHADGARSHFTVDAVSGWPANSHPTGLFATDGPARLTLITCTGPYDRFNQTYADRLIVEAIYAGTD
ncbi:MAG TPA: class F sortase [Candidatus Dormibacteraeota bacterium]|nr:class F sortase [Candidatus Dormibacteraeota bacterium]